MTCRNRAAFRTWCKSLSTRHAPMIRARVTSLIWSVTSERAVIQLLWRLSLVRIARIRTAALWVDRIGHNMLPRLIAWQEMVISITFAVLATVSINRMKWCICMVAQLQLLALRSSVAGSHSHLAILLCRTIILCMQESKIWMGAQVASMSLTIKIRCLWVMDLTCSRISAEHPRSTLVYLMTRRMSMAIVSPKMSSEVTNLMAKFQK